MPVPVELVFALELELDVAGPAEVLVAWAGVAAAIEMLSSPPCPPSALS
jgi:hypothetical protein